ncbi:beta-ketoacyl-ACP synthase II [Actinoallomurus purpureus]|uniref:beta-ketoacyl-ACP synthase II n=1 Tax=Actinoallomurus purpureus TaxID=478114 RepID=UPI002093FEF8|nr:beta-ketoacyl-ACP synthase II [Actinoallomurus purpureus]MCO6008799.1 beta-ketoacyl-ACP synthase II [Actinoallomurus purpureus]
MSTSVVVTGLGATTPLGGDVASTWSALLAGRSGVKRLAAEWAESLPVRIAAPIAVEPSEVLPRHRLRRLDRCQQFALIAAHEAWRDAGFAFGDEAGFTVDSDRVGAVVSSGIGGIITTLDNYDILNEKGWQRVSPFAVPMLMPNGAAGIISIEFGARAGAHAVASACASSAEAIGYGIDMIRAGRADIVIAGGTEAAIHRLNLAAFGSMRAMSTRNDDPDHASRPYDKARDGFVLGEGSGIVILESEEHARARGARIYGVAAGVGYSADAVDIVSNDPDGMAKAMRRALADAGLEPSDIVHINAHGTSTPVGDTGEIKAIKLALGEAAGQIAITSTKSMTGHLLGGTGAVESIATILALRESLVPPTINIEELDDEVDLDIVRDEPRKLPGGPAAALNNSFGFGGHNVTVALRRHES